MSRVGIVGLGIMGSAYARNAIAGGFEVRGFDIDDDRVRHLSDIGGHGEVSPAAVAEASDVVLLSLPSVNALDEVVSGDRGLVQGAGPGLVVVEMGTLPIEAKLRARAALDEVGATCVDAPVSGTGLQADAAEIVVYASGEPAAVEVARPVFDAIAKATFDVGEFGNGSKMKYLANLLVSVHNLVTAETFVLGAAAGLDPEKILEVISAGVGSSRIFEIRGPMMVADDYPPAARLAMFIKDIGVIGDFARSLGCPTPLLDASLPWYEHAVEA
ncbi:MAG TPA: NAD(P)-dependent oxidoreductase, partial [Acidimicrobiia bacterium]|nr:NAD(P)-dependent oxidoreductase [Acidimicrobiia bacterium]